jgi:hypothetical protein
MPVNPLDVWHVPTWSTVDPLISLPLPAPSTSRNLLPRFATATLSRTSSAGISPLNSRSRISVFNLPASSSDMEGGPSRSRPTKRRRTSRAYVRNIDSEEWISSDEEDELDQLFSDNEAEVPLPSQSVGEPTPSSQQTASQTESQTWNSFMDVITGIDQVLPDVPSTTMTNATTSTSVSSPSLARILHPVNIERISFPPKTNTPSAPQPSLQPPSAKPSVPKPKTEPEPEHEPLSAYTCPICFFAPTNATLTPCGHICCGSCLFTAVKTTMQRSAMAGDGNVAR